VACGAQRRRRGSHPPPPQPTSCNKEASGRCLCVPASVLPRLPADRQAVVVHAKGKGGGGKGGKAEVETKEKAGSAGGVDVAAVKAETKKDAVGRSGLSCSQNNSTAPHAPRTCPRGMESGPAEAHSTQRPGPGPFHRTGAGPLGAPASSGAI
jgi:hypothetical protein